MSPKILNLASCFIGAALDVAIHQVILSLVLFVFSESLSLETRIFLSGVLVVCMAFSSLYGVGVLARPFSHEKISLRNSALLSGFLSVLFSLTSSQYAPLLPIIFSLVIFFAVSYALRISVRYFLASKSSFSVKKILREFVKFFEAKPAQASEGPSGEIDTSLRKEYRYNMKEILKKKSKVYFFVKRLFDIFASGCALVILSPILLITAIAIKLEDGGPIIYGANRWGKDFKNFRMYKFRSMKVNADALLKDLLKDSEMTGHAFKIKKDPRITKVGHFIRKYSIDELPQLWNIFTGDMSVVGPRAIMTVGTDTIDDYDKQRWLVRPGLTCYWQVSGRADILWAQWIEMDLDYIENMSITEDVKLILKTFPVVFKAEGAY